MPRKREKSKGTEGQRELADRPDVAPVRDRRKPTVGLCGFLMWDFSLLTQGYITKSTVRICPFVKILNFCFCFCFFFPLLACWCCVGAMSEKQKKKKTTPLGRQCPASRASIRVWHMSDTDTSPKMACRCNRFTWSSPKWLISWPILWFFFLLWLALPV